MITMILSILVIMMIIMILILIIGLPAAPLELRATCGEADPAAAAGRKSRE